MLKKVNRRLKRSDFENSRAKGKLYQSPLFAVSVVEGDHEGSPVRVGFVISKKISKRAVDRNRIKRRLCEVIQKTITNDELRITNAKLIILVRKNILEANIEEIEKSWKMVYEKINS